MSEHRIPLQRSATRTGERRQRVIEHDHSGPFRDKTAELAAIITARASRRTGASSAKSVAKSQERQSSHDQSAWIAGGVAIALVAGGVGGAVALAKYESSSQLSRNEAMLTDPHAVMMPATITLKPGVHVRWSPGIDNPDHTDPSDNIAFTVINFPLNVQHPILVDGESEIVAFIAPEGEQRPVPNPVTLEDYAADMVYVAYDTVADEGLATLTYDGISASVITEGAIAADAGGLVLTTDTGDKFGYVGVSEYAEPATKGAS